MGVVTGIVASPRREGRYELVVDGRAVGVVSLDVVERLALRVGVGLDDEAMARVADAAAGLAAYDRALSLLAAQSRSARDLRRRLVQKGVEPQHADAAVERLQAAGLLDDASFARQFTRSRVLGGGQSKRRVEQELYKRGVAREAVAGAVEEVFDEEGVEEPELVERAARKKLRSLGGLDPAVRRRRLYGFLARRGYGGDAIRAVLSRVLPSGELDGTEVESIGSEDGAVDHDEG